MDERDLRRGAQRARAGKDGEKEIADGKGVHVRSIEDLEKFADSL